MDSELKRLGLSVRLWNIGVAELGYEFVGENEPWLPPTLAGWCATRSASATGTFFTTPESQNHTFVPQRRNILVVDRAGWQKARTSRNYRGLVVKQN
jgi:hypothetical protein